jgi:hypothetical protein
MATSPSVLISGGRVDHLVDGDAGDLDGGALQGGFGEFFRGVRDSPDTHLAGDDLPLVNRHSLLNDQKDLFRFRSDGATGALLHRNRVGIRRLPIA